MTTLLSNFVEKVQAKHWQSLRTRTQKLNSLEKENLLELLEDNLAAPEAHASEETNNETSNSDDEEDYELLQRDLDKVNLRLEDLQTKHDFLQTRLDTYRSKIAAAQEYLDTTDLPPERSEALAAKIEADRKARNLRGQLDEAARARQDWTRETEGLVQDQIRLRREVAQSKKREVELQRELEGLRAGERRADPPGVASRDAPWRISASGAERQRKGRRSDWILDPDDDPVEDDEDDWDVVSERN